MVRHLARSVKLEKEHPAHRATPLATHNSAKVLKNKITSKQYPQKRIKNFGERATQKRKPKFFLHYSRYFVTLRIRNPKKTMGAAILYKYLDADGGLKMLTNSNLQFTNATRLNDPFDCHPSLYDYSSSPASVTEDGVKLPHNDFLSYVGENKMTNMRNSTWICSLSKVHNSLLMWSYYNSHKGLCIGINMEKSRPYLSRLICSTIIGAIELEVKYEDIIKKPNYFVDDKDYWGYQVSTKAKAWEHEQEVRLALHKPLQGLIPSWPPEKYKNDEMVDIKEVRFYPVINRDCFESVYMGLRIDADKKKEVIDIARKLNPNIKIYQMTIDPDAFRLKEELIK